MPTDEDLVRERFLDGLAQLNGAAPEVQAKPPGTFSPVRASELVDEPEAVHLGYVWEDLLAPGTVAALVAKPKVGKTTNAYELAVKVAQGLPYLGRTTTQGAVLIVAVEEHRRDIRKRLERLGADQLDTLHLHVGPLAYSAETFT